MVPKQMPSIINHLRLAFTLRKTSNYRWWPNECLSRFRKTWRSKFAVMKIKCSSKRIFAVADFAARQ